MSYLVAAGTMVSAYSAYKSGKDSKKHYKKAERRLRKALQRS